MKLVELLLEIIGWLTITLGTAAAAGLIAFLIYYLWPAQIIIPVMLLVVGLIVGAMWATNIWIKYGTVAWLSQIRRIS